MKIITSHDVDHLHWFEHIKDTYALGVMYRSLKALGFGESKVSIGTLINRFFPLENNRVREINEFNKEHGVTATFFFGMRNGLKLSYPWKKAKPYIEYLIQEGAHVGLHGMAFDSLKELEEEKKRIESLLPKNYVFGVRNHYLRKNEDTLNYFNELGFLFDSTHYNLDQPFKVGNMWEIPIAYMDADRINHGVNDFEEIKQKTLERIEEANASNVPYFVINFHDVYFTNGYKHHLNWYKWIIPFLIEKGYEFTTFKEAVNELSSTSN